MLEYSFSLSASAFRSRWDKIHSSWSQGGGGAILAYKRNRPIQDILWIMRLTSKTTLESYLQETPADSLLTRLPEDLNVKRVMLPVGDGLREVWMGLQHAALLFCISPFGET